MKKLLALLLACTTLTCAFASCGDEDDDKDEKTTKSSAADEEESEEESEEETEEETEEESEEETEEETEEESEEETEEETTKSKKKDDDETDVEAVDLEFGDPVSVTEKDILGKWELYAMIGEDETMVGDYMGAPIGAFLHLEFNDDGSFLMYSAISDDLGDPTEAEWSVEDGKIVLDGEAAEDEDMYYDGTYLVLNAEDEVMAFVKVDEFTPFDYDAWLEELMAQYE
jgi:DNA mismatch repair ATPase MutL